MYFEDIMAILIVLAIVAAIVGIIVLVVKRNKRKRAEADAASIEELKNHSAYTYAKMIKEELEKQKGYKFNEALNGEARWDCFIKDGVSQAYGVFSCMHPVLTGSGASANLSIIFSVYKYQTTWRRDYLRDDAFNRKHGIVWEGTGVFIASDEDCDDVPDDLKFVAEKIEGFGYSYTLVESKAVEYRRG